MENIKFMSVNKHSKNNWLVVCNSNMFYFPYIGNKPDYGGMCHGNIHGIIMDVAAWLVRGGISQNSTTRGSRP
jgi:hypothetical protein